ncbi:peptidase S41 [Rhodohalobacter sp. SW132]|uniref:S41 family peptidase n=1 Tax=Rhodohalobacter sp. SW132 TaxID=2293433 RepID=UPI000E25AF77|nr:S41 family peptidase [Rhodohalobacter sp. SW132]REL37650.1 peptidase S41 [Rhodohalobacter sp. SW132]
MKKSVSLITALILLVQFSGCSSTSSPDDVVLDVTDEKLFVWNGLNHWYFWQDDVADLADNRFRNNSEFNTYLNRFNNEESLFNQLLHRDDNFSWLIQDYKVHEEARLGISKSFGFRFGLLRESPDNSRVFGYVRYVVPDSPADIAGLKRGDLFNGINGQILTVDNYQNQLNDETYALMMARVTDYVPSPRKYTVESLDKEIHVTAVNLQENPIHRSKVIETETSRVGYLMYNSFRFNFHDDLNERFREFKNVGIDDLVIDLRYNGGGTLVTSALLASLISGISSDEIFAELIHGSKRESRNNTFEFLDSVPVYDDEGNFSRNDPINSLRMNRLYVLTSRNSASASEVLINGLLPFGTEIILIGEVTAGKDEGSITVYDAPSSGYSPRNEEQRAKINPNHMRAMQPIIFKIFNKERADYPNGFFPAFQIREFDFLENLPELGDPNEPLLSVALNHIKGDGFPAVAKTYVEDYPEFIFDSADTGVLQDEIYLLPGDF